MLNCLILAKSGFLTICLTLFISVAQSQTKDKFLLNIDSLKFLLSKADTLSPFNRSDTADIISGVNTQIAITLTEILTDPQIIKKDIGGLLKHPFLGITHSYDKRLWIFNWFENTGGSFRSNISVVYYKTKSGSVGVGYDGSDPTAGLKSDTGNDRFVSNGAGYDAIYKLRSKSRDLYLCIGSGVGCNTCTYQTAVVVELTKNGINFNYSAFKSEDGSNHTNESSFLLGAREDDIKEFSFDTKAQTLKFVYFTDDNTPLKREEGHKQKRVMRKLIFNGKRFTGDPYN